MGAIISFDNIDKFWGHRPAFFEVLLYHSVIRHSSRNKLPTAYEDVEREISFHLNTIDPETYPEISGGMFLLEFDAYPLVEQKELLAAMKQGVQEIREAPRAGMFHWRFEAKDQIVDLGKELIGLMEQSLAASEAETAAAAVPDTGPAQKS